MKAAGASMRIRMEVGGREVVATLDDNATSRSLAALLPLVLTLEDYASAEKVSLLPRRLSTDGAPPGTTASAGDVMYYAPWGNLAIFYEAAGYAAGLIGLGALDDGVEIFRGPGALRVTMDIDEDGHG